jgi:hydrogenase nickel incorporation protein HypA/HybF
MHEMSLCKSLLGTILAHCSKEHTAIESVQLSIGQLVKVDEDSFRFSFKVLTKGTLAQGARLEIETLPARAHCEMCHNDYTIEQYGEPCPQCKGHQCTILQGEEMNLRSMVVR